MLNRRKLKALRDRVVHLPHGKALFAFLTNTAKLIYAKKTRQLIFPYPDTVMLEVTNRCQLACTTCARGQKLGDEMDKGMMDLGKAKKFIDDNHAYLNRIALTGLGEPLLYKDLPELSRYIKEKNSGIQIFLSSNAQLKDTPQRVRAIAPYITTLQLSLDGVGDSYEAVRHEASFEMLQTNVKEIVKLSKEFGFSITGNMVVYTQNYTSMSDVIEFAHSEGIDEITFNTLNQVSYSVPVMDSDFYDKEPFVSEFEKAKKLAETSGVDLTFAKLDKHVGFKDCPYSWGHTTVTWDGFLVPCCAKPFPKEKNYGNVFEKDFRECVNSEEGVRFRKLAKKNIAPEFCKGCHYISNNSDSC